MESKSLKLYLWGFRDRPVFAEALAAEIAGEIFETAKAISSTVTLTQRPRGGITISATASALLLALEPRLAGGGRRAQRLAARRHDDERDDVGQHRDELVGDLVEAEVDEQGGDPAIAMIAGDGVSSAARPCRRP